MAKKNKTRRVKKQKPQTAQKKKRYSQVRSEKKHSEEQLELALMELESGGVLRTVAEKYAIPKSTLWNKWKFISPLIARKGPQPVISKEEESKIVDWLLFCSKRGFPITKSQLLNCVQKFVQKSGKSTPFKNGRPGTHWFKGFMNRHPNISQRICQNLTSVRASISEDEIRRWFKSVETNVNEKGLAGMDASRIFNCDESAFILCPESETVLAERGARNVYQVVGGSDKESVTVLFMANAKGDMAPPQIVLKGSDFSANVAENMDESWGISFTESGWQTADSFFSYITNVFFKWLMQKKIQLPILLFVDGHKSHITLPLCEFCVDKNIELVPLFPNATHILQPLDVTLFHSLKEAYRKQLLEWRIRNNVLHFQNKMFPTVLKLAVESIDFARIVKKGFETTGLHPLNPDAVCYNILNKPKKRQSTQPVPGPAAKRQLIYLNNVEDVPVAKKGILQQIESSLISPDILQEFRARETPRGSAKLDKEDLFKIWCALRKECGKRQTYFIVFVSACICQ